MTAPIDDRTWIYSFIKYNYPELSNWAIAGWMGNLQVESGYSPTANNPGENAWGIAQWEGGRLPALQKFAADHNLDWKGLLAQAYFMAYELDNGYQNAIAQLNQASDLETATIDWRQYYEGAATSADSERLNAAQEVLADIVSGKLQADPQYATTLVGPGVPGTPGNPPPSGNPNQINTGGLLGDVESIVKTGISDLNPITDIESLISGVTDDVAKVLSFFLEPFAAMAHFFDAITWIFNVNHFWEALLYIGGAMAFIVGFGLVFFGPKMESTIGDATKMAPMAAMAA